MDWSHKIQTEPTVEPVTTAEAKTHLNITHTDHDTYIGNIITAAREWCEDFTGRAFISQQWRLELDSFPNRILLPRAPMNLRDVVSNGSFDSSTGWTVGSGWAVSNGRINHTAGNDTEFGQEDICTSGNFYYVEFRIGGCTAGSVQAAINAAGTPIVSPGATRSANGTYGEFLEAEDTDLRFYPSSDFDGWIDDVRCYAGYPVIQYVDTSGVVQDLANTVFAVYPRDEPAQIRLSYQQTWPSVRGTHNDVTVLYWAGYGDAATSVPKKIKQAILAIIGSNYEFREALSDRPVLKVFDAAEGLLWPYRTWLEDAWR